MTRFLAIGAFVLALVSLALNVVLISRLNAARDGAVQALDRVSTRLEDLNGVSFQYNARVQQTFPVSGELPFNQQLSFPINTTIPVNTTVNASVNTPLGPVEVPVAINTTVPINLNVPISISRTIPYSLSIPIDLQVPITVRLKELGIEPAVKEAQDEINKLKSSMQ